MKHSTVHGIVTKNFPMGEHGVMVTMITKEQGKVKAVAKGVKKIKNSLSGGILPLTYSEFLLYQGRSLKTVVQYKAIDPYSALKSDLEKTAYSYFFLELAQDLSEEEEPNLPMFRLLYDGLEILKTENGNYHLLMLSYLIKLLDVMGYFPELNTCLGCGETSFQKIFFSPKKGGILCGDCASVMDYELYAGDLKVLQTLKEWNFPSVMKLKVPEKNLKYYEKILLDFLQYHTEKRPKSLEFIHLLEGTSKL